jgi:DinB superfamily
MARPTADEYAPNYAKYVAHVPEDKVVPVLKTSLVELLTLLRDVSEEEAGRIHPPYTWTIKQVIGHVTDCERAAIPLPCPASMKTYLPSRPFSATSHSPHSPPSSSWSEAPTLLSSTTWCATIGTSAESPTTTRSAYALWLSSSPAITAITRRS